MISVSFTTHSRCRIRCWHALPLLLAFFFFGTQSAHAQAVSLADDAYHYRSWADGQHDGNYTEWWYFNFSDSQSGLRGIVTYLITDPANLTGLGFAQVTAVVYTPTGIITRTDKYPVQSFVASYDVANVQVEPNSIEVSDSVYQVRGSSRDGRLGWNLQYRRQADPWFAANHIVVGSLPWEQMNWLIFMPRAQVDGSLIVDQQVFSVHAQAGYHDHNWGEWIPFDALWNWAQYSQPGLSLEMGDFIGRPAGTLGVDFQDQHMVFTKDQYRLLHTRWALDPGSLLLYPIQSVLVAQNDSFALLAVMNVVRTDPLRADLPFPLPDVLVFEQVSNYQGLLWRKNSTGQWLLQTSFQGGGFKEYTARQY